MAIDSGSEQTQQLALLRASLNATAVVCGSKATSGAAAALSATPTAYTGGVVLTNAGADDAEIIWICTTGVATVAGADCYPILKGKDIPLGRGDLATISAIAASGTPTIAWVGTTL